MTRARDQLLMLAYRTPGLSLYIERFSSDVLEIQAVVSTLVLYLTAAHLQGAAGGSSSTAKASLVAQSLQHAVTAVAAEVTTDRMERYGFWAMLRDSAKFSVAVSELTKYLCREEHGDTNEDDRHD